ncbi:transcription factor TFIIIB component B'' homolog isoform X2 [Hemicordylus capensis]|uniref:transcription factor TFIIIB component B'' homolog isoform X2 n=1 Tax=Hemicordylus capensis TaxID=884348 RepID=UPI002303074B|nr:transcription factor TFIIIB component B'' homolog isoform X2 [Hemicordylus capensis]
MFRRARFSVKPNVRPTAAGRGSNSTTPTTITTTIPSSVSPAATATPDLEVQHSSDPSPCSSVIVGSSSPQPGAAAGDPHQSHGGGNKRDDNIHDASGDKDGSKHAETVLQRRKRISTMPNLAKPRFALSSTPRVVSLVTKGSQKQVPHAPTCSGSPLQKESSSPEKINIESSPKSPILPEKKTPVPQVPQFSPFKKSVSKESNACITAHRSEEALQKNTSSPLKERPTQERLMQDETSQSKSAPEKEKRICSDREKIIKAQKLRKMLKEELKKEKQQRKNKCPVIEKQTPEDRSKMIMRDFIYYLPENNPMKTSLVEEKKMEKTSTVTQAKEPEEKTIADHEDENEDAEEEEGEEEDGPLLVPRVKVAEDGSIILDEESLTVEVLRTKGQCVVEENDPIFERGSTTTYSSFRKSYYTKPWSEKETDMFFLAISMVGTDFSMISQLFPHRARTEIKNKFKREEKSNGWRIDKAFKEKRPFDFVFFTKLLEKVLENERRKKENDAKCQHPKEKISKEKKAPKPHKKRTAKTVNGQPNRGQDDHQNVRISDEEMEVDSGTAEKENEESLSILEQSEGQTVTESVMTKKRRKRKKRDSELEAENSSEERNIPADMSEGQRTRKERENTSSGVEISGVDEEDLAVLDGESPDETLPPIEEEPQCFIQLNEGAKGDASQTSSSMQESAFIEAESGELDDSETGSEHYLEQPFPSTAIAGFDESSTKKNEVAELDKNSSIPAISNDDETSSTRASKKSEPPVNDTSGVRIIPSESLEGTPKNTVEDKVAKTTGPTIEDMAERTNNDVGKESQETQNVLVEKTEMRGRWQKLKPNIVKVFSRKEEPGRGKLECRTVCPEPDGTVGKNNELDDTHMVTTAETVEKDFLHLHTKTLACEKSTLQENSKQTILKPALLARGRMQRIKPNLGKVVRRQGESPRNTEAEGEKATEVTSVPEKTVMQHECSSSKLLIKETAEATSYEADMSHPEVLENKAVACAVEVDSVHTSQPPVMKPLECESCELKNTSLSSDCVEGVTDLAVGVSGLQQKQKEITLETEHACKSYLLSLEENVGKAAERKEPLGAETKMLEDKHETENMEKSSVTSEHSKCSDPNETATCGILPSSHLLEQCPEDVQDVVATGKNPATLTGLASGETNEVSLPSDIQEKTSLGRQSSQEESNQSGIQPTLLLRGRFQRPKPNIGRAIGKKEIQPVETNKSTAAIVGTEKSELQKSTRIYSTKPQLNCDGKILSAEAQESRLVDCEKLIQEDSQVPSTSQTISDQCVREKSAFQEDKPNTIKPAQLVRGRFQRAKPNLGRINGKKKVPVAENVGVPVERERGKSVTEGIRISDLNLPSQDEVNVQTSLCNLEEKNKSESSEAILPESCIEQNKQSSPEKLQRCELLKDQEETCVSKDVEGKHLDIPESDIAAPQEISQTRHTKTSQLVWGHLQKPKPDLTKAAKKKESSSEGEVSMEDKIEGDAEGDLSLRSSTSGKISIHDSGKLVEAASSSKCSAERKCADIIEVVPAKRNKHTGKCESSEQSSRGESQSKKEIMKPISIRARASEILKRKLPERTLKQKKTICESRTDFSASGCGTDHGEKGRRLRKAKPNVSRGRSLKPALAKKPRKEYGSSKVNLVTLRASSQEEEEEDDDADDFLLDDEVECFSPEEVNKAPVFVPKGLRSPNPVPVQIEETMEELEIYENVADEPCVAPAEYLCHELNIAAEPVIQGDKELYPPQVVIIKEKPDEKTEINDGSTEAAMTLLAMRDPVLQLSIITQENEKTQKFPTQDVQNIAGFSNEHNEKQSVVHSNVPLSAPSKNQFISSSNMSKGATEDHGIERFSLEDCLQEMTNLSLPEPSKNELVSSHTMNKAAPEDQSTSCLEECSQEATRVNSYSTSSKGNNTSSLRKYQFPKPKPNLSRGLGLNCSVPQKSLSPGSDVEQMNEIQNEEKASKNVTEGQKVPLEQNLRLDKLAESSSADNHDLQPGSASQAMQKNNPERENLVTETWKSKLELTAQKPSPEVETYPPELQGDTTTHINVQLPENISVEHDLRTIEVMQTEESKHSSISATTEITAVVSGGIKEYLKAEEPTFILTLVEIPADAGDCSAVSTSLQSTSQELLPASLFLMPDNTESVELTREDRSTTAIVEENAASMNTASQTGGLQATPPEHLADPGSVSWKNKKRKDFEGSSNPLKKRKAHSAEQSLKSSNKETSLKLRCIPRKTAEKRSDKLNTLEKKNSSASSSVHETTELQVEERELPQSSLNLGSVLLDEAASTDEHMSRTLHVRKAETSKGQRSFVKTCTLVQSEQVGSRIPPKMPLSRPTQRSLRFSPLICKTNSTDEEGTNKANKQILQKPHPTVSKSTAECPTLSPRDREETQGNGSYLSTISLPSNSSSSTAFFSELSENEGSTKEQEHEEEPTKISEYFFSDIFMEVDDSE